MAPRFKIHEFERKRPVLEKRARMMRDLRSFFEGEGFTEVETPILQVCPSMDLHVHGPGVTIRGAGLQGGRALYLQTSPELDMKKLLCAGMEKIFQVARVFRDGDDSRIHSPEFTMIEWYRAKAGYRDIMKDCVDLLRALGVQEFRHGEKTCDAHRDWEFITVAAAFAKYAGMALEAFLPANSTPPLTPPLAGGDFNAAVAGLGIRTAPGDSWEDLFFRVMAEKIEPHLGVGAPCILYDYPVALASLARKKPEDPRFAERFEVYACGVELANGFGELTDPVEQRARFDFEMKEKERLYGERYPADEDFFRALEFGLPPSGGIAMGFDRLVMLATGAADIEDVMWAGKP